jgi:hypothetical protein
MSARHTIEPRQTTDPLSPFVQLVTPGVDAAGVSVSVDTLKHAGDPVVSAPSAFYVESLDDMLAEEYPLLDASMHRELHESVQLFISSIREQVGRGFFLNEEGEFSGERSVAIRYGPARLGSMDRRLVWIECRCNETEAYLLPCMRPSITSLRWYNKDDEILPERFHDGPARLLVEIDPQTSEIVAYRAVISPQCTAEAEANLIAALRSGGFGKSSYLLSQYHEALVERAIESGELSKHPSEDERRAFVRALPCPIIEGGATSSDRVSTVSLRYFAEDFSDSYRDEISLQEISPWGLSVSLVTRSRP